MSIYSRRYSRYEGPIEPQKTRFAVIADTEVRRLFQQKWVRRLIYMAMSPVLGFIVYLYFQLMVQKLMNTEQLSSDVLLWLFQTETWFVVIMMAAFGSGMIARDVGGRALTLYFTRPLGVMQYLGGKLLAVMVPVLAVTLVPGILLALSQLLMSDPMQVGAFVDAVWRVAAWSLLVSFVLSTVILLLSALGMSSRYVGLVWLALFVFLDIAHGVLSSVAGNSKLLDLMSIKTLCYAYAELLFRHDGSQLPALVALVLLGAFAFVALRARLGVLEQRAR